MAGHHAYFKKEKGGDKKVVKAPLNKWAQYRRSGYVFATEEEYAEQQAKDVAANADKKKVSKKKKAAKKFS